MKKIICLLMTVVLRFAVVLPSFAQSSNAEDAFVPSETEILAEIEAAKAEVFESVFLQLKEQDMISHLPIYMEILLPEIEQSIRAKYGTAPTYSVYSNVTMAMPYGGVVAYYSALGNEVISMYLDKNDANNYIINRLSFSMADVFTEIAGRILPAINPVFNVLAAAQLATTGIGIANINSAGGYGHVMQVAESPGSYSTVILGWSNYSYITYNSPASYIEPFPYNG